MVSLQTKCHQYWPDPPDVMEHGSFHIRCQSEDCTIAYVFREMLVTNTEVSSPHTVSGPGEGIVQRQMLNEQPLWALIKPYFQVCSPGEHFTKHTRTSTHIHSSTIHNSQQVKQPSVH